jgi:hypothetical protein
VVAVTGVVVNELPGKLPGIQIYEVAPLAVNVAGEPEHTDDGPLAVIDGIA